MPTKSYFDAIHAIMRKMRCSYHLAEYFYSKGHRA